MSLKDQEILMEKPPTKNEQEILMANYPFEKCCCAHILRGEGGLRKCMFCTFI